VIDNEETGSSSKGEHSHPIDASVEPSSTITSSVKPPPSQDEKATPP